MMRIGDALRETMELFAPLPGESSCELGRFAAQPLVATVEVPAFDASLVDGYAVRASDVTARCALRVEGESRAGGPNVAPLRERTAMRIFTGAPIPAGADAVVMQELVTRDADLARFEHPARPLASIRPRGSDVAIGDRLVEAGATIDAGMLGLLATQRTPALVAHRRPRVAIVTTGDELLAANEAARPGAIPDSNGPMLAAMVLEVGGVVASHERAHDVVTEIARAIGHAITSADLVLTVGGVSVGDHDLVHAALAELGVERKLWKVRMKPGKPLAVSVKDGVPIIGLPGNPVSAWVGFEVFVRPGLRRMLGDPKPHRRVVELPLGASVRATKDRTELARARIDDDGVAWPLAKQGSSALTSVTNVDTLLILPERDGEVAVGERVPAMILGGRGTAQPPFP